MSISILKYLPFIIFPYIISYLQINKQVSFPELFKQILYIEFIESYNKVKSTISLLSQPDIIDKTFTNFLKSIIIKAFSFILNVLLRILYGIHITVYYIFRSLEVGIIFLGIMFELDLHTMFILSKSKGYIDSKSVKVTNASLFFFYIVMILFLSIIIKR
jgi:uncharacterized membrane protein YccF (DUF307 family)